MIEIDELQPGRKSTIVDPSLIGKRLFRRASSLIERSYERLWIARVYEFIGYFIRYFLFISNLHAPRFTCNIFTLLDYEYYEILWKSSK